MTPATEKSISSGVLSALTLVIAARSEPAPESARLETVKVAGVSLVSSDSRRGRKVVRERRRDTVFFMETSLEECQAMRSHRSVKWLALVVPVLDFESARGSD